MFFSAYAGRSLPHLIGTFVMRFIWCGFALLLWVTVLTGLLYPVAV
jgi:hypothetical protein